MPKKKIIIIALLIVVVIGAAYWYEHRADNGAPVLYGNVDIREVQLSFRVGGRLAELSVDEGNMVRKGDVLARLDSEPIENQLKEAEANLAAVAAKNKLLHRGYRTEDIAQARAELQARQAALIEAEKAEKRQQNLVGGGAVSKQELESAVSRRDQAKAQVKAAQEQHQSLVKGYRTEEIQESDAALKSAVAASASARLSLKDAILVAPSDGMIITRAVEPGSMLSAGMPVLTLSLTRPVWIRAYVNEKNLGKFPSGTKVLIYTDSRAEPYHGKVGFVSPTAEFTPKSVETEDLRTALVYRLRIVVENPDSVLRQGMPVTINLQ